MKKIFLPDEKLIKSFLNFKSIVLLLLFHLLSSHAFSQNVQAASAMGQNSNVIFDEVSSMAIPKVMNYNSDKKYLIFSYRAEDGSVKRIYYSAQGSTQGVNFDKYYFLSSDSNVKAEDIISFTEIIIEFKDSI